MFALRGLDSYWAPFLVFTFVLSIIFWCRNAAGGAGGLFRRASGIALILLNENFTWVLLYFGSFRRIF